MLPYYSDLSTYLHAIGQPAWADQLEAQVSSGLDISRYGDLPQWLSALEALPPIKADYTDFKHSVTIGQASEISPDLKQAIETQMRALIPWRKGPFSLFDIFIDSEWRSDWKWDRVLPHIHPLAGRRILDVGCSNGYHCFRMLGEGAERVIGIDPSPRFAVQFLMLKHFLKHCPIDLIPVGLEALPPQLHCFDTTFSMGVLYHRRNPMEHLEELKQTLVPGGQLILETLVIEGKDGDNLIPDGRYAKMRNVWSLPSVDTLINWVEQAGFIKPRVVDINQTSVEEQRATDWMQWQSLADFLDPENPNKTVEGHPAPIRAIVIAETP